MNSVKFSIILPVFNAQSSIERAILSVLNQSYVNWELLIVDDGSTDESVNIVTGYLTDLRIKLVLLDRNQGVSFARNLAISNAVGEVICFLDSDDWWDEAKLHEQAKLFKKGAMIVYSPYYRVKGGVNSYRKVKMTVTDKDFYILNPIPNLTGAFSRKLLPISQLRSKHEDYLMWWTLTKKAGVAYSTDITRPLAYYSVSSNSISSNKILAAKWHWNIIRNHFKLPFSLAVFYLLAYGIVSLKNRALEIIFIIKSKVSEICYRG
jgi:teichuronic acid biosynthesis glycosyltransferase TuaG